MYPQLRIATALSAIAVLALAAQEAFPLIALDRAGYYEPATDNPVARLAERLERGDARLEYSLDHGYLPALLKALDIPVSSQTLVFSKTSFQAPRISPRMPRAIYHRPDVYVGWVRGGDVVELAAVDAARGVVFYTLDQERVRRPKIERRGQECLQCHLGSATLNVPGLVVRSVETTRSGNAVFPGPSFLSGTRSPLEERWGGWYVTGTHGSARHMGNVYRTEEPGERRSGLNRLKLDGEFNTLAYLAPDSDLVSLMVMEHQTEAANWLVRALFESRTGGVTEATVRGLADVLSLKNQATWKEAVKGTSAFARDYSSAAALDLRTRLFGSRRSPMIDSAIWRALPTADRERVLAAMP